MHVPAPQNAKAPQILLVTAGIDRHARELIGAFGDRGAEIRAVELAAIGFDTGAPHGLAIPGFGQALPDAVCVRTMDAGSFEQVTRRLGVLHALSRLGVIVSNDARAVENCVDKSATSFLLARAGIPSPRSYAVETRAEAARLLAREARPMVLKPLFGAQGKGLKLIASEADLPAESETAGGVYYLQHFAGVAVGGRFADVRILVSAGRPVAAMRRESAGWITNIKQGAEALPMLPDPEFEAMAVAATKAVGGDFCGVDLLRDENGRVQVIEVNSMPAWTGLKRASGQDIAAIRAADLLALIGAAGERAGARAALPA
ncbi:MAG TPA: RimK family alpha-L-glutamate ligase [Aurantimonas sp.]|nr:RimK family alpha-L-glutamate ligase [Aurantimonas sp.]